MVNDQEHAVAFYTETLGFKIKADIPMGDYRWLTVVSPDQPDGIELLLEPISFPPSAEYQQTLYDAGIPWTSFAVDDIQKEYERMNKLGVTFKTKSTKMGPVTIAIFDDTCGNLIQIAQQ
jgi:predicted enzyme related to lactoylglutathione lyase